MIMKKRKYNRKCGNCKTTNEQSQMVRTNKSSNGWLCEDCWKELYDTYTYNDVEDEF